MAKSTRKDGSSASINRRLLEKAHSKPWWKFSSAIVITAIILVVALITFYPRPVIGTADKSSGTEPLTVVVTLRNNGVIPLRKVKVWLENHEIDTVGGEIKDFPFSLVLWQAPTLRANDKPDINLDSGFLVPPAFIESANVTVRVEYQPWFLPWTRTKNFPFRVLRQRDGAPRLVAVPTYGPQHKPLSQH